MSSYHPDDNNFACLEYLHHRYGKGTQLSNFKKWLEVNNIPTKNVSIQVQKGLILNVFWDEYETCEALVRGKIAYDPNYEIEAIEDPWLGD